MKFKIPPMSQHFFEDYAVGQTFGSGRLRVDADAIRAFAAAFDPQPFHLDDAAAQRSLFKGLAASGWHTAALSMRLLVEGELKPAGGLIGAGLDEIRWPLPVRPGDELHVVCEILELRRSQSRRMQGIVKIRTTTFNQHDQPVQVAIANLVVPARNNAA